MTLSPEPPPSRRKRLIWAAFLLAVGGVGGILFWGGFNTALEYTNRLEFCVSCHEMQATSFAEYSTTAHYRNASGVRAICTDCHVPHEWLAMVIRKIQATSDLYHHVLGTIDTPEKYEAQRLAMARRVWAQMEANNSQECRNCHSWQAMDVHKQRPASAEAMRQAAVAGESCISCHKGVAHKLPDME